MDLTRDLEEPKSPSLHIAVFSEYLVGFYQGELVNHIRQLCALKRYKFSAIRTGGLGEYDAPFGVNQFDGVVIVRNAISKRLAEDIKSRGIPMASIGYEYVDSGIPTVGADNEAGVELALDQLLRSVPEKVGFVGTLTEFDHYQRLEAFKNDLLKKGYVLANQHVYDVPQSSFIGGQKAAAQFLSEGKPCSSVLCASGLIGLGFIDFLINSGVSVPEDINVITFDPIAITPMIGPKIITVDQCLNIIALKSINLLESLGAEKTTLSHYWVQPKLIFPSDDQERNFKAYLRVSTESAISENTNYMKCISSNCFEWTRNIVETSLDEIMSLSIVFKRFMRVATFSRVQDVDNQITTRVQKYYTRIGSESFSNNDTNNMVLIDDYPGYLVGIDGDLVVATHFPIELFGRHWGMLSFYGVSYDNDEVCSYLSFASYIDIVCYNIRLILECQAMTLTKNGEHTIDDAVLIVTDSFVKQWNIQGTAEMFKLNVSKM